MSRVSYRFDQYRRTQGGTFTFSIDGMSQWHPALSLREYREVVAAIRNEFAVEFASGAVGIQYRNTNVHLEQLELWAKQGAVVKRLIALLADKGITSTVSWSAHMPTYLSPLELKHRALQKVKDRERDARNKAAYEARGKFLKEQDRKSREAAKAAGIKREPTPKLQYPSGATWQDKFLIHMRQVGKALEAERNRVAEEPRAVKRE